MTRWRYRAFVAVWLLTLAVSAAAVAFLALSIDADVGPSWGFRGFAVLFAITFGTVGVLINVRVPGNRVGVVFTLAGLASAIQELIAGYVAYSFLVAPEPLPGAAELAWFHAWDWVPGAGLSTTLLLLLFPDGRLPSPRWRPVAALSLVAIVLVAVSQAITPGPIQNAEYLDNPLGAPLSDDALLVLVLGAFGALAVAILLSVASLVVRFRRSRGAERAQLKWFASAAGLAGIMLAGPGTTLDFFLTGSPSHSFDKASEILTIVALLGIPIAAGIAILHYHLYDIDRIVSRTVGYAFVTVVLFAAFIVVNLALQGALSGLTDGDALSVAASTLAAAALFSPVRARVQRVVDRRFHRTHADADQMVRQFSVRLRDELDLDALADELDRTVAGAVQPTTSSVWLRTRPG